MRAAIKRPWEAPDIRLSGALGCAETEDAAKYDPLGGALSIRGRRAAVRDFLNIKVTLAAIAPAASLHSCSAPAGLTAAAVASRAPSHVRFTEPTEGALSLPLSLFLFFFNHFTRQRVAQRQRRETSGRSDLSSDGAPAEAR